MIIDKDISQRSHTYLGYLTPDVYEQLYGNQLD